jgi:hypothetical protein
LNMDLEQNGEQENGEGMDQLSMEQLMESSLQSLKEGDVTYGHVVAVTSDEVMVDIGYKCEARSLWPSSPTVRPEKWK